MKFEKISELLVKSHITFADPRKFLTLKAKLRIMANREKLTIKDKVCRRSDVKRVDLNWRVAPLSLTFLQIIGSSSWSCCCCWCMVSCGSWSALALGCAGACVLPNIGHFIHGWVLVGGLNHFLRLALLGAAFVVSSALQEITMLVGG